MRVLALIPLLALVACDTAVGTEITRDMAKSVTNQVVEQKAPGVPIQPVSDCVIDNASGSEIVQIGSDALTGSPSPETINTVVDIALRDGTIDCFVNEAGRVVVPQLLAAFS